MNKNLLKKLIFGWCAMMTVMACSQNEEGNATTWIAHAPAAALAAKSELVVRKQKVSVNLGATDGQAAMKDYCSANRCEGDEPDALLVCGGKQDWCFCVGKESCRAMATLCAQAVGTDRVGFGKGCGGGS